MKYPIFKVHLDTEAALSNLREVFNSGYIAEGVQVKELATELSKIFDNDHVVLLNSCTSALTLALVLAGVGPGDEVVTTSMTCLATNTPIMDLGATPVWADVDRESGMIDPEAVRAAITDKTKAVMCVNWAGVPAELAALRHICEARGIKLIQDAAHAFGAKLHNEDVSKYADFTCYSFQAIKHFTTGDGGALICDDPKDYERAMRLKWFGIDREASKDEKGNWKGQAWNISVPEAGFKFHMNNISAAIGLSQLRHVPGLLWAHVRNAGIYNERFKGQELVRPMKVTAGADPTYWVYTILTDESVDRDKVLQMLNKEHGIGAALVHVPNHPYECFAGLEKDLPNTEYFASRQISLPCGWWIKPDDVDFIVEKVIECCEDSRQ